MTTSDDPNASPREHNAHSRQQPGGLFRRFFARLIDGWIFVIAWIVIAVTIDRSPTNQGIHDRWAGGTQVVKKPSW